ETPASGQTGGFARRGTAPGRRPPPAIRPAAPAAAHCRAAGAADEEARGPVDGRQPAYGHHVQIGAPSVLLGGVRPSAISLAAAHTLARRTDLRIRRRVDP